MNGRVSDKIKMFRKANWAGIILGIMLLSGVVSGCGSDGAGSGLPQPPQPPPPIKHKLGSKECLSCHKEGKEKAPKMKHPAQENCTGCHKPLSQ